MNKKRDISPFFTMFDISKNNYRDIYSKMKYYDNLQGNKQNY